MFCTQLGGKRGKDVGKGSVTSCSNRHLHGCSANTQRTSNSGKGARRGESKQGAHRVGQLWPSNSLETWGLRYVRAVLKVISWKMSRESPRSESTSWEGPFSLLLAKPLGRDLKKDQSHTEFLVGLQCIC